MSDNPSASPADDGNPYRSPSAVGSRTGNPLMVPAIFLLTLSSIMLLMLLVILPIMISTFFQLAALERELEEPGFSTDIFLVLIGYLGGLVIPHLVMILGSINMIRLKGYNLAQVAGMLAVVPFCSAFGVVGIPFGIWALVLLRREEVRQLFRSRRGNSSPPSAQ